MPTIDVTEDEAKILVKLLQLGLKKVQSQNYVMMRAGRREVGQFMPEAQRLVAVVSAQVALSK